MNHSRSGCFRLTARPVVNSGVPCDRSSPARPAEPVAAFENETPCKPCRGCNGPVDRRLRHLDDGQAVSGGGIGAAGGAGAAAVTGGNPVTGALLGGAAGAAIGGLTKSKDLNLGNPVWR